jgi:hypothetical protein
LAISSFSAVVTLKNPSGNLIDPTGRVISLAVTNSEGAPMDGVSFRASPTPSPTYSASAGQARFNSLKITKAGSGYYLRAIFDPTMSPSPLPLVAGPFGILPGPAASLIPLTTPSFSANVPLPLGSPFSLSVQAVDQWRNPVSSYQGNVTLNNSTDPWIYIPQGIPSFTPTSPLSGLILGSMPSPTASEYAHTLTVTSAGNGQQLSGQLTIPVQPACGSTPIVGEFKVFSYNGESSSQWNANSAFGPKFSNHCSNRVGYKLWGGGGWANSPSDANKGYYQQGYIPVNLASPYAVQIGKAGSSGTAGGGTSLIDPSGSVMRRVAGGASSTSGSSSTSVSSIAGIPYSFWPSFGTLGWSSLGTLFDEFLPKNVRDAGTSTVGAGDGMAILYYGSSLYKVWREGTTLHLLGFNLEQSTAVTLNTGPGTVTSTCSDLKVLSQPFSDHLTCTLNSNPGVPQAGTLQLGSAPAPSLNFTLGNPSTLGDSFAPTLLLDAAQANAQFSPPSATNSPTSWTNLVRSGASPSFFGGFNGNWSWDTQQSPYSLQLKTSTSGKYLRVNGLEGWSSANSVEAWIRTNLDDSNSRVIYTTRSDAKYGGFTLGVKDRKLFFRYENANMMIGEISALRLEPDTWYHVVGTWNTPLGMPLSATDFQLYVNGLRLSSQSLSNPGSVSVTAPVNQSFIAIGGVSPLAPLYSPFAETSGSTAIGRIATYNRALSPDEIVDHCKSLTARFGNDCMGKPKLLLDAGLDSNGSFRNQLSPNPNSSTWPNYASASSDGTYPIGGTLRAPSGSPSPVYTGSGNQADPFRIQFPGRGHLTTNYRQDALNTFSIEVWMSPSPIPSASLEYNKRYYIYQNYVPTNYNPSSSADNSNRGASLSLFLHQGRLHFGLESPGSVFTFKTPATADLDQWSQWVFTWQGPVSFEPSGLTFGIQQVKIYKNGQDLYPGENQEPDQGLNGGNTPAPPPPYSGPPSPITALIGLGWSSTSNWTYFTGSLARLGLWERALSPKEVYDHCIEQRRRFSEDNTFCGPQR